MSDLFSPDAPRPQPSEFWDLAVAMLDADPHALDDAMASMVPSTAQLVERFPELATVEVTGCNVTGPHGPVPVRSYVVPGHPVSEGLVWVHGGAFVFGNLDMLESHWVALALAVRGIPVFAVDYRKAIGGTHFPVPSDDVFAAWQWAVDNCEIHLGVPSAHLHLGGGSAGANLSAGVAKRLRDNGGIAPASLVLAYGVFHHELPTLSDELVGAVERHPNAMLFTPEHCRVINVRFVGDEAALSNPYAFPANGDLAGMPPTYLLNSEADYLRASGDLFGQQLSAAGVTVKSEFEPGTAHGHLNEAFDTAATTSIERIVWWLTPDRFDQTTRTF